MLDDCVYLKTVQGLERIEVIYSRMADSWLDPLVFRRNSQLGIPGLVHCLRKGTVTVINGIGSQLADDRALLPFAHQIIKYYLGEKPILPTLTTYWLGDIDQMEMVLANLDDYQVRSASGYEIYNASAAERPTRVSEEFVRQEIRRNASRFIAQPATADATTLCFEQGKQVARVQDHIVFALRSAGGITVFPGALTRVFESKALFDDNSVPWTSKDTWVLTNDASATPPAAAGQKKRPRRFREVDQRARQVTSRVADAFYWMGPLPSSAPTTRHTSSRSSKHSKPRNSTPPSANSTARCGTRLLPPLETSAGTSRRSITNRIDRYRLVLLPEPGTVVSTFNNACRNAESIQESLSPEAWSTLSELRSPFRAHEIPLRNLRPRGRPRHPQTQRRRHAPHPAILRRGHRLHARGRRVALLRHRPDVRARHHHPRTP